MRDGQTSWEKLREHGPLPTATKGTRLDPGCLTWNGLRDKYLFVCLESCSLGRLKQTQHFHVALPLQFCFKGCHSLLPSSVGILIVTQSASLWIVLEKSGMCFQTDYALESSLESAISNALASCRNVILGRWLLITHWPPCLWGVVWREVSLGRGRKESKLESKLLPHGERICPVLILKEKWCVAVCK